jgi:hypothetical protein
MKPLDDSKTIDLNTKLENDLNAERSEWNDKVIDLVNMLKDNRKLSEAQVFQLSYRQQVQERIVIYKNILDKRQGQLDKMTVARYREYSISYDIKLSSTEKEKFLNADFAAMKQQVNMIKNQIDYFEECVKTLDNFGFAVRNKIEIISQQI